MHNGTTIIPRALNNPRWMSIKVSKMVLNVSYIEETVYLEKIASGDLPKGEGSKTKIKQLQTTGTSRKGLVADP
jgi:hypothetical protein